MASEWYVWTGFEVRGPIDSGTLRAWAQSGHITPETDVGRSPTGPWVKARQIKGLFAAPLGPPVTVPLPAPIPVPARAVEEPEEDERAPRVVYRYRPQLFRSLFAGAFLALGATVFLALGLGLIPLPDDGLFRFLKGSTGRTVLTVLGVGWAFFALFNPVANLILALGDCKVILTTDRIEIPQLFGKAHIPWKQVARVVLSPIEAATPNEDKKVKVVGYMLRIYKKGGGLFGNQRWISSVAFDSEDEFFDCAKDVLVRSGRKLEHKSLPLSRLAKADVDKFEEWVDWLEAKVNEFRSGR